MKIPPLPRRVEKHGTAGRYFSVGHCNALMTGRLVLKNSSKYDKFLINGSQLLGRRHIGRDSGHVQENSAEHDSYLNFVYSRFSVDGG